MSRKHKEGLGRRGLRGFSRVFAVVPPPKSRLVDLSVGRGDALCCVRPNAFMEEAGFGPGRSNMHTGETLAAAPPARPLRQSRLGGLSLFLALAGVAIALAVMALALPGPGRHRPQPVVPALGLACAEHGGGRDPDGPGANRVVVPQRPGGAVRHDLLPPGLTRSATVRRQPGRPRFGRSFIGLPDCSHSSRICRGRGSAGEGGCERSKR